MRQADSISRRDFLGVVNRTPDTSSRNDYPAAKRHPVNSAIYDEPGYAPVEQFDTQQFGAIPAIDPDAWRLTVGGLVEIPLFLTVGDLLDFNAVEIPCTLACCGHSAGSKIVGHALWRGAAFQQIMERLTLTPDAKFARFDGADGYSTSVALADLNDALIAHGMNGATLSPGHGFPARLIVPGLYGYKLPKWITRIEFSSQPYAGFWEQRGWSQSGTAQTMAAILRPRHLETVSGVVTLTGIAYAGTRDITTIEVNIDDGPWMPVPFLTGTRGCQVQWQIDWQPPAPADYAVKVQVSDSSGFTYTTGQAVVLRARG